MEVKFKFTRIMQDLVQLPTHGTLVPFLMLSIFSSVLQFLFQNYKDLLKALWSNYHTNKMACIFQSKQIWSRCLHLSKLIKFIVNTLTEAQRICLNMFTSCHFLNTPAVTQGDIGLLYIPPVTLVCLSWISQHIIIGSRSLYWGQMN